MPYDPEPAIVHLAGPYVDLVQKCRRCGSMLSDYRNCAWPEGQPGPSGQEEGALIAVGVSGSHSWIVREPGAVPTCAGARA